MHCLAGLLLLCLAAAAPEQEEAPGGAVARPPLNVLFLAVDDLRPELGCFGVEHALELSPNIDRLADEGVLFTQHFVAVPTCGASRYALLTGRSPARSGVRSGNDGFSGGKAALRESSDRAQTLPELFRRSGYRTVCIGKVSHTADGRVYAYDGSGDGRDEVPGAWDEVATPYGAWRRGWGAFFAYADGEHREDGEGHRDLMQFVAEADEDLPDGLNAKVAVEKLTELSARGEPFFLAVGFYKPHLPFVATKRDWQAVATLGVPPPPRPERPETSYWHQSGELYGYDAPFEKTRPLAPEAALRARRAYLACVRYTDRQIGKVLDALEELELADSTVVVLWGDHGWHLGDSALWGKHTPFERAVWSPLIVRAPGAVRNGERCAALVETIDLFPTLVELCRPRQRETEHALDGTSLVPLLTGEAEAVHTAALSYWGVATAVRSEHHRLIFTGDRSAPERVELYDLREGPDPTHDLAETRPEVVKRLLGYVD